MAARFRGTVLASRGAAGRKITRFLPHAEPREGKSHDSCPTRSRGKENHAILVPRGAAGRKIARFLPHAEPREGIVARFLSHAEPREGKSHDSCLTRSRGKELSHDSCPSRIAGEQRTRLDRKPVVETRSRVSASKPASCMDVQHLPLIACRRCAHRRYKDVSRYTDMQ